MTRRARLTSLGRDELNHYIAWISRKPFLKGTGPEQVQCHFKATNFKEACTVAEALCVMAQHEMGPCQTAIMCVGLAPEEVDNVNPEPLRLSLEEAKKILE